MPGSTGAALVGRDTALGDVAQFVDAVASAPSALLLEGDPGIVRPPAAVPLPRRHQGNRCHRGPGCPGRPWATGCFVL